ncbi:MAG: methyltransferase domain-containing protein [Cyclobacteriaceae bacterium]|nr:methyltransferase domain-containing protein [Cyclobacteriaceae bacterium]
MAFYKTEITSDKITSDNPIHQRLMKPYVVVREWVKGDLLELGCGEGRGFELLSPQVNRYLGLDKIEQVIDRLKARYGQDLFRHSIFPPVKNIEDQSFDTVVSFQVIEHIRDDEMFLREIYRILKPGGMALITTPNKKMTLTRNPWHIREYEAPVFRKLARHIFDDVDLKGITGNQQVMEYYARNKKSVEKIVRYDVFNLQNNLPAFLLKIPYEILNRYNRNRLKSVDDELVRSMSHEDYLVSENPEESLDIFALLHKK